MAVLAWHGIATQSIVPGSSEGRWVYHIQRFSVRILLTGMSVAAASCVLLLSDRITGRDTWRTVFVWVVLAVALQAVLRSLTLFTFESIFVSLWIFLACSFQIPAACVCARLESRATELHCQKRQPGKKNSEVHPLPHGEISAFTVLRGKGWYR